MSDDTAPPTNELHRQARLNEALAELAGQLLHRPDLEASSALVLEQARLLTDSPFGYVGYIDPADGSLVCPTMTRDIWDTCEVPDKSIVFREFGGLWGWVLTRREPLLSNDPNADPRSSGVPGGHLPIHRFISVPVLAGDTLLGQIALANAPRPYTESDLKDLERLAVLYALAVRHQRDRDRLTRQALSLEEQVADRTAALEEAVSEASRFREALDQLSSCVYMKDSSFRYTYANRPTLELFGCNPGELPGSPDDRFFPPETVVRLREIDTRVLAGGHSTEEIDIVFADGDHRVYWEVKTPIYNKDRVIVGLCGISTDITEIKHAEERLEAVLEGSQLGFWDWDIEKGTVHRNRRWAGMLGYTLEEIEFTVRQWTDLIHPDDRERALHSLNDHLEGRSPQHSIEYRMQTREGGYKWILDQATVVKRDSQGKPLRMSGTHTDVTERKRIDEVLVFLAQTAADSAGEDFFRLLARYLASSLEMDFICIDVLEEENLSARTLAMFVDGVFDDNVSYTLADTPCGEVVAKSVCCYRDGVRHHFLKDQVLQDMLAESYVGTILWSSDGCPIGLIAVIGRKPLADPELAQKILSVVGMRAAAELERTISEQALFMWQRIFQYAEWGMVVADPATNRLLNVNHAFAEMHGYTGEEMTGMNLAETFAPESRSMLPEYVRLVNEQGYFTYESLHLRKDGTTFPALTSVTAFNDNTGRLLYHAANVIDITDRKLAEEILRTREEQFRMMFEHHDSVMVLIDPLTGAIIDANGAAARFYGYDSVTLKTKNISDINTLNQEQIKAERQRALHEERNSFIFPHRLANGDIRMVEVNSSPISYQGQSILFSIIHDISRRIRAEEQLQKTLADLSRSNEELERFAYVASHDLQEPIRMIMSYTQLLEQRYGEQLDESARQFIGYAVDGARRMHQMINDLLAYSRVGTQGKHPTLVAMGSCCAQALGNLKHVVDQTGAEVTVGLLPTLTADGSQLVQLFQNLIANALKFHGEVIPRVSIRAEELAKEWRFAVADNGIGLDPAQSDRIFQIFQRLHGFSEYPGTGIGLAVCKRIVERHGGRIWVESTPGAGATFFFTIPKTLPTEMHTP
jgi:PAS domain S-box-containing protein